MPWFPERWPPRDPQRIQLYSALTPNGQKVSIALEELGLAYDAHRIDIDADDQFSDDYQRLSPNGKIPTLSDPDGPDGNQILLMESGAILLYLADKTGKLISGEPLLRQECIQWLFFQMGHIGPMFGQFGHFYRYAADKTTDEYGKIRYKNEVRRLLAVLDKRLDGRQFLVGEELTIAEMAIVPWVECLTEFYDSADVLNLVEFNNVERWRVTVTGRAAYLRGRNVCGD